MSAPEVIVHRDAELLAKAVAARLVTRLVDAAAARGTGSLVLTGGGIGTAVLSELAAAPARDAVDWRHLDVWWGDERFVPSGDKERNETGARAALLDHVDVDPARVHPMAPSDGPDGDDPDAAAARYATWLKEAATPEDHGLALQCPPSTYCCWASAPKATSPPCSLACRRCTTSARWSRCAIRRSRPRRGCH